MNANELRIGNFYHWEAEGKDYVLPVMKQNFSNDNHLNFKPIPLTKEWLLNLGFDQGGYDFLFWYKNDIEFSGINWADKEFPEYQFLNFSVKNKIFQIYFVHQLQNLYFALTSEELILKS